MLFLLLKFAAPCFWDQVIHRIPDSRCTKKTLWPNTTGEVLSPRNDVRGGARAFATTTEKKWSSCSPWMALVDTFCPVGGGIATSKSRWDLGGKHSWQTMCIIFYLEMHHSHSLDLEYPTFWGRGEMTYDIKKWLGWCRRKAGHNSQGAVCLKAPTFHQL